MTAAVRRIDGSIPDPPLAPVLPLTQRLRTYQCDGCGAMGSMPTHGTHCWRYWPARLWNSATVTAAIADLAAWEAHQQAGRGETRAQRAAWASADRMYASRVAASQRALLTEIAQQAGAVKGGDSHGL